MNASTPETSEAPKWRPLDRTERRVLGVLVEKAKTTPDAYPMTLNGLRTGANQKSNRAPQMQLEPEEIEDALERLREYGAASEVQSDGRVAKYRHYIYAWMGIDKYEAAVMAELLLRGEQTLGELRGRAARMEDIPDQSSLKPILQRLMQKQLVIPLTPEGRGQVITHNLYQPKELERLKEQYANLSTAGAARSSSPRSESSDQVAELREEVAQLKQEVGQLRQIVENLQAALGE